MKNIFDYVGLGLAVLGTGAFVLLYNFPYESVNFNLLTGKSKSLNSLNLSSKSLNITGDSSNFTAEAASYLLETETEYRSLVDKGNLTASLDYNLDFFTANQLLAVSFRGTIMTYSKATKFNVEAEIANINFGVENDFILNGLGDKQADTYNYYIFPVSNVNSLSTINLIIDKI